MLTRGEHPPRALQLMDAAKALHPGGVDEVLLRCPTWHSPGAALGDTKVSIDGIAGQIDSRILSRRMGHPPIIRSLARDTRETLLQTAGQAGRLRDGLGSRFIEVSQATARSYVLSTRIYGLRRTGGDPR